MVQRYETIFIVNPVLSEQETQAVFDKFSTIIKSEGQITAEEHWGNKQLSYPIKHKKTGTYFLLEFETEPNFVDKLTVQYKRDENILRFLIVKMDKHAIDYANKVRNQEKTEDIVAEKV